MWCDREGGTTVLRRSPLILRRGADPVLEKVDLPGLRDVVVQDVLAPPAEVLLGGEARERPEVADQGRLVEVPALRRDPCPVGPPGGPHPRPRPLEPPHPAVPLRRRPHRRARHPAEPPPPSAH